MYCQKSESNSAVLAIPLYSIVAIPFHFVSVKNRISAFVELSFFCEYEISILSRELILKFMIF